MIVDLEAVLERVLAHLGAGGQKPPALAALKALTELAFWSSLERYEARETRFRYLCHTGAGDEVVMLATLPEEAQVTATLTRKLAAAGSSIVVRESKPGWVTAGLGFASGVQQLWVDADCRSLRQSVWLIQRRRCLAVDHHQRRQQCFHPGSG